MSKFKNVEICFRTDEDIAEVVHLSNEFAKEGCCNRIVADGPESLMSQNPLLAKVNHKIIGYAIINIKEKEISNSYTKKGDKSCIVEEIYVSKKYRNQGLGSQIFNFIENYAKEEKCSMIELYAVSKDYSKLLSFYIDKLGMTFWIANLYKRLT